MAEETLSGLKLFNRGKVRDIYDLGDKLLLVASDRISAFDVILPTLVTISSKVMLTSWAPTAALVDGVKIG